MATFVLVHGSWFGADAWTRTADHLRALGYQVVAPDLPGHGEDTTALDQISLESYTAAVVAAVTAQTDPVVLVGHSMGGTVISQVAEQTAERIRQLVYVAAFMLADGQSLFEITQSSPGMADSLLGANLVFGEGVLGVNPAATVEVFMADAPAQIAGVAAAAVRPEPLAPLATPIHVTAERWGSVPRTYVHTTDDRVLPIASQRELVSAAPGTRTIELSSSHSPFLSQPEQLADVLSGIAGSSN